MKKIDIYTILYSDIPASLADRVNDKIESGFQPFGPPFIDSSDSCVHQAMVLYDEENEDGD